MARGKFARVQTKKGSAARPPKRRGLTLQLKCVRVFPGDWFGLKLLALRLFLKELTGASCEAGIVNRIAPDDAMDLMHGVTKKFSHFGCVLQMPRWVLQIRQDTDYLVWASK